MTAPSTTAPAALREEAEKHLQALVGSPTARLRDDQWVAIEALVADHRRALVVQRTGWGKSAVYFVSTALLRAQGAGPTVIVSPLLALMRNQIAAAEKAGIRAVTINSTNNDDWSKVYRQINEGTVDVLLVSPERLNNPEFRDEVLPRLSAAAGLLVIDEAHCISDWGHDFRPDYRRIRTMLADLPADIPVLATTATANQRVTADIAEQLDPTGDAQVVVLRGELDRESLHLAVVRLPDQQSRMAWLAEHLNSLPGSGIIYCLTVAATQEITDFLRSHGYDVASYSGQTEQTERLAAEDDLLNNRIKALVATSALGMGYDKPDLGFVINVGAPPSPIAYYQQIGRAGRGVDKATVVLLPLPEDRNIWDYFASLTFPPEQQVRETISVLGANGKAMSTAALETHVDLRRTRLEAMLKVLDVDGAVRRVKGGWEATGQPWVYDGDRYDRVDATRKVEQKAMLDYITTDQCRMQYLRDTLDDHVAVPCGRCDNCGGISVPVNVSGQNVTTAAQRLAKPGVSVDARRQWPTGMPALNVDLKGRLSAEEMALTGKAVGRYSDLGWGGTLRTLLHPSTPDQEIPRDILTAVIEVLSGWDWPARPVGVVAMPSHTRPILVQSLARRLGAIGRLPYLGALTSTVPTSPRHRANSAQRLAAVADSLTVGPELAAAVAPTATTGPVLLVDDWTDTGWTLTVAARLLRQAGAPAVLPLVLAINA